MAWAWPAEAPWRAREARERVPAARARPPRPAVLRPVAIKRRRAPRSAASSVVHLESIPIGFYRNSCGSSPATAKMVKLIESKVRVPGRRAHPAVLWRPPSGSPPAEGPGACGARPGEGDRNGAGETLERRGREVHALTAPGFPELQSPLLSLPPARIWRG